MKGMGAVWGAIRRALPWSSQEPPRPARERPANVLAILPDGSNRILLDGIAHQHGWVMTTVNTMEAAAEYLHTEERPIILFDREMAAEGWREPLKAWSGRSPRPCVMLISRNTDVNLWDEFQRLGGSDILRSPLVENQVVWAIKRGWLVWRGQQQVRGAPGGPAKRLRI